MDKRSQTQKQAELTALKDQVINAFRQGELVTGFSKLETLKEGLSNQAFQGQDFYTDIALAVTDEGTDRAKRKAAFEAIKLII